jgi:hypothetical protein
VRVIAGGRAACRIRRYVVDEASRDRSQNSYSVFHAQQPEEIAALVQRLQTEALAGTALTAVWIRMPRGRVQVQLLIEGPAPEPSPQSDPRRLIAVDELLRAIREALHLFNDLPALEQCALAKCLTLTPYLNDQDASFARGRALQRAVRFAVARLDERPTRRSVPFSRVFDCVHVRGMSQERAAELLHVENRTVRRALADLACALAEYWTGSAAVELSS